MKAGLTIAMLLLAAGGAASATTAALPPMPPVSTAQADDADAALSALGERLGVDVTIAGAGPYRFMVDSGANRTVVSRALADRLQLVPDGEVELHSMVGRARVATVRLPGIELGGMRTGAISAPVLDEANLGGPAILGIDALAGKRVTIDIGAGLMTIRGSTRKIERAAPDEIVVVAKRRRGQLILTEVTIDGLKVDAVIDSGSEVTIGNAQLEEKLAIRRHEGAAPVELRDVIGRRIEARMSPLTRMKVGDLTLENVPVAFAATHAFDQFGLVKKPALLIGMDVLRAFRRVSIDFASRSVRFLVGTGGGEAQLASAAP